MKLIKLDAIPSTNDFLKELSRDNSVKNFTVVVAKRQSNGRGQMGSEWKSEAGKNLTMSVLVKDIFNQHNEIFNLNIAVSLSVVEVLEFLNVPNLTIKWPNDIMSDSKKIGGILIENSFKTDKSIESIIGIGLNINQSDFLNLPNASSLFVISKKQFDLDNILIQIVERIKNNIALITDGKSSFLWEKFHQKLFKIGTPMAFEDVNKNRFMGIIKGVSHDGKLQVLHQDESIKNYGIKEIILLY